MTTGEQSIALCMIVRDEAEIIDRCLDSVSGLIDSWVICDTGSSDQTCELIRKRLSGIPGELHDSEWVDFGHNRSELMEIARGSADYLLLMDADMTVQQLAPLPPLQTDAYLLRETGALDFGVVRLVRGDRRWWYEGSTHEHLATGGPFGQQQLDELMIVHHADGSARWHKLIRDVGLLKRDIVCDQGNPRPVFYLAQTYRDLGKPEQAIDYYRQRVEMGGWDEEVFYANLQEGILRAEQDLNGALPVLLEAWQRRPTRAEPLYQLARAHRRRGDLDIAHMFATRGLEVTYPNDVLFILRWVYDWGLHLERALAAADLGRLSQARADLRRVSKCGELPPDVEDYVREALEELGRGARLRPTAADGGPPPRLAALAPSARIGEIRLDVRPAWPCFNPSIAGDDGGFRMVVRTANYQIELGVLHPDGTLYNLNYLLTLDSELTVTGVTPISDRSTAPRRYPSQIQGYEDCRLFAIGDRWFATATVCDLNPIDRREIALLAFEGDEIVSVRPLSGLLPDRHEKNWMPLVIDEALYMVYRCGPTTVLRCDPESGVLDPVSDHTAPRVAEGFRGGSQGVTIPDGSLFVIHEVDHSEPRARYLHRFVLLNDKFALAAISPAFSFVSDRVEFCAGMARRGDELVLSFGVSDAAAGLAVVSLSQAVGLLEPVDSPEAGV